MRIKRTIIDLYDLDPQWEYRMNRRFKGYKEIYVFRISHRHVCVLAFMLEGNSNYIKDKEV